MSVFDRAEKRIGAAVDKVFARAFKGDVQPVEIATGIHREMDAEAKLLSRSRKLVPNEFIVSLSDHDYDRLYPYSRTLNEEVIPSLRQHATERSYVFNGPVHITYKRDSSLPTGQFKVTGTAAEIEPANPVDDRPRQPVIEVNGIRHPLVPPGLTIGRGSDVAVRIEDPGVSRHHAFLSVTATPTGLRLRIEDTGSTNGLIINGQRVASADIGDGTRIEIGNTRLLVYTPMEA